MAVKKKRTAFLLGRRSEHHNTEQKNVKTCNLTTRTTRTPLRQAKQKGGELRCPGRVHSSCSTSGHRRVTSLTNPVISHERRKDRIVITTNTAYTWSYMTKIFR